MKKIIFTAIVLVVLLGGYYGVEAIFTHDTEIPTTTVQQGEFLLSLVVNGSIDAKQAFTLTAPRIRSLQITWLAPEGSMVKVGDPVIKFDATQQVAALNDHQSDLKIKQTSLERANQELAIQEKQLTLGLQQAQRKYDEMKHDAPKVAEEAKLELELAQLNFKAKLDQIRSDVQKAELEVGRARDKVAIAQKEMNDLTINAPIPGMVVYLEVWKGSSMSKVQTGDSPWPGQGLINLPDLSDMVVKATASEVDASKVDSGQEVRVTLDAFPDKVLRGVVFKKGTLARKKDPGSKINVFDVEIAVLDKDENLKPGMSATGQIIMENVGEVLSVPLEAVFDRGGQTFVYLANKKQADVQVGRRNDTDVEILSGLEAGQKICLVDPTIEEQSLPGDKATEPEMNAGRNGGNRPAGGGNGGGQRTGGRRGR